MRLVIQFGERMPESRPFMGAEGLRVRCYLAERRGEREARLELPGVAALRTGHGTYVREGEQLRMYFDNARRCRQEREVTVMFRLGVLTFPGDDVEVRGMAVIDGVAAARAERRLEAGVMDSLFDGVGR